MKKNYINCGKENNQFEKLFAKKHKIKYFHNAEKKKIQLFH